MGLECVDHMLQVLFGNETFGLVDTPDQDAENQVCDNAGQKEHGPDNQRLGGVPVVHLILENHHVVDAVGKSHE